MELNDNATSHPSTVASNFTITQPDTPTRIKKPLTTRQIDFYGK